MKNQPHCKMKAKLGMVGFFKFEAVKRDGTKRLLADWFPNLILNAGLDRMGTANTLVGVMVGTDSTAPNSAQTSLGAQLAYTTTAVGSIVYAADTTNNYLSRIRTQRFAEGVAAGNLTEVGVGWASGSCFSRALILDGGGSPTTLTVLSDESLDVTYELRIYPMVDDVEGTVTLNGIDYATVLRTAYLTGTSADFFFSFALSGGMPQTANMGNNSFGRTGAGALGNIYSAPGGSGSISASAYAPQTYTSGVYEITLRYTWGLLNGSSSFYNILFRTPIGYFKASFTPEIPKTAANILTLDLTVTWARGTIP